jgi:hypothetical protein
MRVTIIQPAYLPWLGFFDRVRKSELLIVLDHVRADLSSKTKFANRNKIRTAEGWIWLTVPLSAKGAGDALALNRLEINEEVRWRAKHLASLRHNYLRTPYFGEHAPFFNAVYARPWTCLANLCREITDYLLDAFGITTAVQYSSSLDVAGIKDDLILNLCLSVGASSYISGPFGRSYLRPETFARAGIDLLFHDYYHPEYKQAFEGFEPYMSAVDLLFNHGPRSLALLESPSGTLVRA